MAYKVQKKREFSGVVDIHAPADDNKKEKVGELTATFVILNEKRLAKAEGNTVLQKVLVGVEGMVDANDNELKGEEAIAAAHADPLVVADLTDYYLKAVAKKDQAGLSRTLVDTE